MWQHPTPLETDCTHAWEKAFFDHDAHMHIASHAARVVEYYRNAYLILNPKSGAGHPAPVTSKAQSSGHAFMFSSLFVRDFQPLTGVSLEKKCKEVIWADLGDIWVVVGENNSLVNESKEKHRNNL
jgi:hypothetical protein